MTMKATAALPLLLLCACAGSRQPTPLDALERLKALAVAAETARASSGAYPSSLETLGAPADRLDPWGRPPRYEVFPESRAAALGLDFRFTSAGPDGIFGSADDISWPPASPAPEEKE